MQTLGGDLKRKNAVIGIAFLFAVAAAGLGGLFLDKRNAKEPLSPTDGVQESTSGVSDKSAIVDRQDVRDGLIQREQVLKRGGKQDLVSRLQAAREKAAKQKNDMEEQTSQPTKLIAKPALNDEPKLSTSEFLSALREAVGKRDLNAVRVILEKVPPNAECVAALTAMMRKTGDGQAMQRYAAEALMRIGTGESVKFVLDQVLVIYNAGDVDFANSLLAALEAPTTPAGIRVMFDVLLGRGVDTRTQGGLPAEVVSAIRKALRAAGDREAVGTLAAELYLDPHGVTNEEAMWELFDGVAHPVMLAQLAGRAYQENLPENAADFLDRLGQSPDQGAVQAIVQMVPNQAVPLNDVAMALFDWSIRHPQEALPGLFLEYMTDSARPPEQRSVAAFGLAGTANRESARVALEKALQSERDPIVRTNLQITLTLLNQEQPR
jgi:hypothetical protein